MRQKDSYQSALWETKITSNNKGGEVETTHEKLVCCKGSCTYLLRVKQKDINFIRYVITEVKFLYGLIAAISLVVFYEVRNWY